MESKYTLDWFITFYEQIPADRWITGDYVNSEGCCAYGHLGERRVGETPESVKALQELIGETYISEVNDGEPEYLHLGDTPKERVINYLKNLKQWRQSTN